MVVGCSIILFLTYEICNKSPIRGTASNLPTSYARVHATAIMSYRPQKSKKTFAPKGPIRRTGLPSSTPSSARPSVERQSQTPVPVSQPTESFFIPNANSVLPEASSIVQHTPTTTPNVDPSQPPPPTSDTGTSSTQQTNVTDGVNILKRKERSEDEDADISQKRTRVEEPTSTNAPPTPISSQAQAANTLKRKERVEDGRADSLQKRARIEESAQPESVTAETELDLLSSELPSQEQTLIAAPEPIQSSPELMIQPETQVGGQAGPKPRTPLPPQPSRQYHRRTAVEDEVETDNAGKDNLRQLQTETSRQYPPPPSVENEVETWSYDHIRPSRSGSPIFESRQDIASSIYPDPELSSGAGAAGMGTSGIKGVEEGMGLGAAGHAGSISGRIAQAPQIVQGARSDSEAARASVAPEGTPAGKKKKKVVKRKKAKRDQPAEEDEGEDGVATFEMHVNRQARQPGTKPKRVSKKKEKETERRSRGETPEGAEDEEIEPANIKLIDLCKDLRIGKKSENHELIKQKIIEDKQKRSKARRDKLNPPEVVILDGTPAPQNPAPAPEEPQVPQEPAPINNTGPRMRIVNGNIVMDDSSLAIDRHARARAAAENQGLEEVRENAFSKLITSGSYMKKKRGQIWDHSDDQIFFRALRQFGTDFEMIAKLFPSRDRHQIKCKYKKEEKTDPHRLNRILLGKPDPIDLADFEELSGEKLLDLADIEKEDAETVARQEKVIEEREKEKRDADAAKKAAIAERSSQRSEAARRVLASVDDEPEVGAEGSGKENPGRLQAENIFSSLPKKAKGSAPNKRQRKNPNSSNDMMGEERILGIIE